MSKKLKWGILSTGRIAGEFAKDVARAERGEVVAVASRTDAKAQEFAQAHGIAKAYGCYEALLADPEVEAVYIAPPHPQHLEWTLKAAQARKHILCEKPLALRLADVEQMVAAAKANGVLLMEAFMYRCTPQTAKILEVVRSGVLGRIGVLQVTFGFFRAFNPELRAWSNELGGGAILDVGCYPVSFSRMIAGASEGKTFLDPVSFSALGKLHPQTGVDIYTAGLLGFANGIVSQISTSVGLQQETGARIYGDAGWLHVPSPWHPARFGGQTSLWLYRNGVPTPEEIVVKSPLPLYAVEADVFAEALAAGLTEVPQMSLDDSLGNSAVLDQWRAAVGVKYAGE